MNWRTVLNDLIETGRFRTQRELTRAIEKRTGRRVNQATVSRELQQLGARKVDGVYRLGTETDSTSHIRNVRATAQGCLLVVQTELAYASIIAQKVDRAAIHGVIGTIAGDDTVFIATEGRISLPPLLELLGWTDSI